MKKFTFKTDKPTGRYAAFSNPMYYIKLEGKQVGAITNDYNIRLMIIKDDINENDNPNCEWKWIELKYKSDSLQSTKDFLNLNIDFILKKYKLKGISF